MPSDATTLACSVISTASSPVAGWSLHSGTAQRVPPRCCGRTHNEGMTVAEGILLALSVVVFAYLGVAMFKPDWF
jgi:hypothetical protein